MDGEIDPEEVERTLGEDDPVVVDIRSPAAFEQGHIPGSRNIPFGELPDEVESLTDADHVVTVCPHGKASVQAARLIGSYEGTADTRVDSMAGGLSEWSGDLETGNDSAQGDSRGDAQADSDETQEDGGTQTTPSEATDAPF
jgi:rhodanese-related sulfurtransferase